MRHVLFSNEYRSVCNIEYSRTPLADGSPVDCVYNVARLQKLKRLFPISRPQDGQAENAIVVLRIEQLCSCWLEASRPQTIQLKPTDGLKFLNESITLSSSNLALWPFRLAKSLSWGAALYISGFSAALLASTY